MEKVSLNVKGMHCRSCERLLRSAIESIKGVESVTADAKRGRVEVEGKNFDINQVKKEIEKNGYKIE
ncbi:MAG: heavy-metal-associated domain-containing protein [Candidatus Anstonellaceae archaeon]